MADPVPPARERLLSTAYDLFVQRGVGAVGINEIIRAAGVAKSTFYAYFPSKDSLVLASFERRRQLFTIGYLGAESQRRGTTATEQLLAIFDIFDEWFSTPDFAGCPYIRSLVELGPGSALGAASAAYLAEMRSEVESAAREIGLVDPEDFSRCWMILLQGSVIGALAGDSHAAGRISKLGHHLIDSHLPKRPDPTGVSGAHSAR